MSGRAQSGWARGSRLLWSTAGGDRGQCGRAMGQWEETARKKRCGSVNRQKTHHCCSDLQTSVVLLVGSCTSVCVCVNVSKRKKRRMSEIEWSIHKDSKQLDRAGRAKAEKFWYITHGMPSETISFEMHCNNFIRAVVGLRSRHGCIPMGGSFSAQAADLHSL